MDKAQQVKNIIANSFGTEHYHIFYPFPGAPVITDGVLQVADAAGCYWLLDIIASYKSDKRADPYFQVWKLLVNEDMSAIVTCSDGNGNVSITQEIEYTDFPLEEFTLYMQNDVILLPSEY